MKIVPKYVFRLIVFSIVITAVVLVLQQVMPVQYVSPALPYIVLFFFVITLFTLYILLRDQAKKEAKKFVSSYMLSRIIKFMSCLIFLLIYFIVNKEDRWQFAISFIIIYFLFSGFEVIVMKKENDAITKEQHERLDKAKNEEFKTNH